MKKWFGLADYNNFYASCKRIFNLSVRDVPIVILSNNDGCMISRSQEAKDLGIPMGVPTHKIKDLIVQHNVQVFSSNYTLYGEISARVMNCLSDLCPAVEVYSIDEAFLDLSIIPKDELQDFGVNLKQKIAKWTKIPICISIAPTKSLAKIVNCFTIKNCKNLGIFIINSEEILQKTLGEIPIEAI